VSLILPLTSDRSYDWRGVLEFLAARATPGVEVADLRAARYAHAVRIDNHTGVVQIAPDVVDDTKLVAAIPTSLVPIASKVDARLRELLDLDADLAAIRATLANDPRLAPLIVARPQLCVPGCFDRFSLVVRAVLGQQVSVRGASTLAGRLTRLLAEPLGEATSMDGPTHLPIAAERLAAASVSEIASPGIPRARAECLHALGTATVSGILPELAGSAPCTEPEDFMRRFMSLPGIGPWTASYVAMRALRWSDAFPDGDLALRKAMGGIKAVELRRAAEHWRPWRAYAVRHLWASLS
jgi:AraC family transcriptional regulator, regulatory protein of adaptative response / DNA-3-methyladenine glycosylase II